MDITTLIVACNKAWTAAWHQGDTACGDETIIPCKSKRAARLRQYVPRKPHNTGLKLYALTDAKVAYVHHVYLYRGVRGLLRNERHPEAVGGFNAAEIVQLWADLIPHNTTLVADTYFGSHQAAEALVARGTPFVLLVKRDAARVKQISDGMPVSSIRTEYNPGREYAIIVYKNPKVGAKAPRVVPFVTNCRCAPLLWCTCPRDARVEGRAGS